MLSGSRGAKYGLQLPAGKKGPGDNARAAKPKAFQPKPAIFSEESDEENVEAEIARQAAKKRSDRELEQQHAAALKEDPNVFDYDGVYDQMKEAQAKPAQQQAAQRQPRYIGALLKKAKERERTQEMVMERKIQKEQAAEAHLYGDKEKFVTGAYKRKLAEDAKWREEERRREELEAANDVSTKGDLSDFYRNLLNKNEAFGGGARAIAVAPQEKSPTSAPNVLATSQVEKPDMEGERAQATEGGIKEPESTANERSETERLPERAPGNEGERIGDSVAKEGRVRPEQGGGQDEHVVARKDKNREAADTGIEPVVKEEHGPPSQKASKVDAVADAKARYLARKKQRT